VKTTLGNSRLIYKQTSLDELDYHECIKEIDEFIESNPKLMRSNKSKYIYFFSPSSNEDFSRLPVWVAREVVGFSSNDLLDDSGLGSKDLNEGEVDSFNGPEDFSFEQLFKLETKLRSENKFVDSWRVKLNFDEFDVAVLQFWQ
jgi:hypothetical protein